MSQLALLVIAALLSGCVQTCILVDGGTVASCYPTANPMTTAPVTVPVSPGGGIP